MRNLNVQLVFGALGLAAIVFAGSQDPIQKSARNDEPSKRRSFGVISLIAGGERYHNKPVYIYGYLGIGLKSIDNPSGLYLASNRDTARDAFPSDDIILLDCKLTDNQLEAFAKSHVVGQYIGVSGKFACTDLGQSFGYTCTEAVLVPPLQMGVMGALPENSGSSEAKKK